MSMRKILTALAAVKAVKDYLAELDGALKADLMEQVGGRMSAAAAVLPDGAEAATVTITRGRAGKWQVVDDAAFLTWVKANRPTAVVESVRSSDTTSILAGIETTGEVPDGVMQGPDGDPYVTVRQSAQQRAATVTAWRAGLLALPSMDDLVGSLTPAGGAPSSQTPVGGRPSPALTPPAVEDVQAPPPPPPEAELPEGNPHDEETPDAQQ